jgi:hypothetical protein
MDVRKGGWPSSAGCIKNSDPRDIGSIGGSFPCSIKKPRITGCNTVWSGAVFFRRKAIMSRLKSYTGGNQEPVTGELPAGMFHFHTGNLRIKQVIQVLEGPDKSKVYIKIPFPETETA